MLGGCLVDEGDDCMQREPNVQWYARGCMPNMFSERAQWSFVVKPTSDKYSTSERLKGKSSLVSEAARIFANICRFRLMRPKIPLCSSHGKRLCRDRDDATFQPNEVSTEKVVECEILMSHKEGLSAQGGASEVTVALRGWHIKQGLNVWTCQIKGEMILNNEFILKSIHSFQSDVVPTKLGQVHLDYFQCKMFVYLSERCRGGTLTSWALTSQRKRLWF